MPVHEYRTDTQIVLMGRIRVADWRNELRHMELSLSVADSLLKKLAPEDNELELGAAELLDLLQGQGEIANYVKLSDAGQKVNRTLTVLTRVAWEHDVPSSVDEIERADGDEYFDSFSAAYTVSRSTSKTVTNVEVKGMT